MIATACWLHLGEGAAGATTVVILVMALIIFREFDLQSCVFWEIYYMAVKKTLVPCSVLWISLCYQIVFAVDTLEPGTIVIIQSARTRHCARGVFRQPSRRFLDSPVDLLMVVIDKRAVHSFQNPTSHFRMSNRSGRSDRYDWNSQRRRSKIHSYTARKFPWKEAKYIHCDSFNLSVDLTCILGSRASWIFE